MAPVDIVTATIATVIIATAEIAERKDACFR
jgi:hypothetical protein